MNSVTSPTGLLVDTDSRRAEQYSARRVLWTESSLKRVRTCGHHGILPDGNVAVKLTKADGGSKAGFSGLATCGSTWACPVCSAKIGRRRSADVSSAVAGWQSQGHKVVMVTLTMRHRRGQRLAELWDSLSYAWGRVTSGRAWAEDSARFGAVIPRLIKTGKRAGETDFSPRIGFARVVETTHGANGWHVHVHALMFVSGDVAEGSLGFLAESMYGRWALALVDRGLTSPVPEHGVDVRVVAAGDGGALGRYFSKNVFTADKAGFEVAGGSNKKARNGNRTPFQILADVLEAGDADDLAIWWEWEEASHNRRQLTWSAGLRDFLALGDEVSDEEAAAEELGGEVVLMLSAPEFLVVRWYAEQLLHLIENQPLAVAKGWISSLMSLVPTE